MALIELRCQNCGRRVIIDSRDLDCVDDEVRCPYCRQWVEIPDEE